MNGVVYGSTNLGGGTGCYYHHGCGTVFSITTTGKENWLHSFTGGSNGSYPEAGLIDVNGALYGTTSAGGDAGGGTVYRISTGGAESVVHRFRGLHSGPIDPETGLVHVDGMLYGTTTAGGSDNAGTVYSISPAGAVKISAQLRRRLCRRTLSAGHLDLLPRHALRHERITAAVVARARAVVPCSH